jgi:hypothetical protein
MYKYRYVSMLTISNIFVNSHTNIKEKEKGTALTNYGKKERLK